MSEEQGSGPARRNGSHGRHGRLTLGALGVVFGDIGTSPPYAMSSIFSLIVWMIIRVVMVKYMTFVMRAGNRGEGGIMAQVAPVLRLPVKGQGRKAALVLLGIFGVALFSATGFPASTRSSGIRWCSQLTGLDNMFSS